MKDVIFAYLKYFSAIFGAGVVLLGIWKIRVRVKHAWRRWRGEGVSRRPGVPRLTPDPALESRVKPTLAKDAPTPCLLLTCFEQQQPMFLQALNISDPGYTAFDAVVCLRAAGRVVYLTPPLFDAQAPLTWSVLRMAAGAAEHEAVPLRTPDGKRGALSPQDVEVLAATTCYFGIDLAMTPLEEQIRTDIRTTLQQLQETFGPRLCVLKLHKDVVDGWPSVQRARRLEIWTEIFNGLKIRKAGA
jgi:hypothetical protein